MDFNVTYAWSDEKIDTWKGRVTYLTANQSLYEFYIQSRSGFLVLIGKHSSGYFACLPDFQAGCYLSSLNDLSYNRERLISALNNPVDGVTVAKALKALADVVKF